MLGVPHIPEAVEITGVNSAEADVGVRVEEGVEVLEMIKEGLSEEQREAVGDKWFVTLEEE